MKTNYYLVEVMCGHVGTGNYIPIVFPVYAENASKAAEIARLIPRVKHNNKNAILNVVNVTKERFDTQIELNNDDEYLNWKIKGGDIDYSKIMYRVRSMQKEYTTTWDDMHKEQLHSKAKKSTTDMLRLREIKNIELHIHDYLDELDCEDNDSILDQNDNYLERSDKNFGNSWLSQPVLQF